jgi:HAD superfamily hydrolase (TIGR01450 family)
VPAADLSFDGLACDLDGVVYRGEHAIDGAAEAIERLRSRGVRIVFCTNNSRSTVGQYVEKLQRLGVPVRPDDILTSAVVTAEVLAERGMGGSSAIAVGGEGVLEALSRAGIQTLEDPDSSDADLVVVGWDPAFDYGMMKRTALAVRAGARLIATNNDAAFPASGGALWPGAGAILASIEVATGAKAEVMGKPHPPMMKALARRLEGASRIAVVGDRPDTDLEGGVARGWTTILVTSGVVSPEEAVGVRPRPDLVLASIADLT